VRNYGEGLGRMTGSAERLDEIGTVEIHPISEDRIDDWLDLFDHDVFAGFPQWSACYCAEPHLLSPDSPPDFVPPWQETRAWMIDRLHDGTTFGYLAYVDGRVAGWVNASKRCDYTLFGGNDDGDAGDAGEATVGVSCFAIAPPYRAHGIAPKLLARAVADAAARGATHVEAYPFNENRGNDNPNFRGARRMYDDLGFTEVSVRERDVVVRRAV
jgi:GNAT superfamily N-acetyltransferase